MAFLWPSSQSRYIHYMFNVEVAFLHPKMKSLFATRPAFATTNAAVSFFCSAPLGLSETKLGSQSLCHETSCLETGAKLSRRSWNQFQWCSRITASKYKEKISFGTCKNFMRHLSLENWRTPKSTNSFTVHDAKVLYPPQ